MTRHEKHLMGIIEKCSLCKGYMTFEEAIINESGDIICAECKKVMEKIKLGNDYQHKQRQQHQQQ